MIFGVEGRRGGRGSSRRQSAGDRTEGIEETAGHRMGTGRAIGG